MCIIPAKKIRRFVLWWWLLIYERILFFVVVRTVSALWELDLCLSQANGLESIPWVSNRLPSIWAGRQPAYLFLAVISVLLWNSLSLHVLGSRSIECKLLVFPGSPCPGKSGVFFVLGSGCHWHPLTDGPVGCRFYLQRLPLTGCLLRSSFLPCWRAEMGCWTICFLFLASPLLLSLAGIKRIVTSWLLKGLFKEGCSVLPLVETYSHPRACSYCFRAVTLKLSSSPGYPAVINSEVWIRTKIQITNHKVKKSA